MIRIASWAVLGALVATACHAESVEIGSPAPAFKGQGVDGKEYSLDDFKDAKAVVICFTCNECPIAVAYEDRFIAFAKEYKAKGVRLVAINVNTESTGGAESLEDMKQRAEEKGFTYPYVKDASGESALAYGASVTPHVFVLDGDRKVAYMGSFDDNLQGAEKHYVQAAVDAVLSGKAPETTKTRPFGCGIKIAR